MPAERAEEISIEGQAALDRGDDEVDMMDAAGAHEIQRNFGVRSAKSRPFASWNVSANWV